MAVIGGFRFDLTKTRAQNVFLTYIQPGYFGIAEPTEKMFVCVYSPSSSAPPPHSLFVITLCNKRPE